MKLVTKQPLFQAPQPMKQARDYLIEIRLDFINNYLTLDKWAEHNGLTLDEARDMLNLARKVSEHEHPEA